MEPFGKVFIKASMVTVDHYIDLMLSRLTLLWARRVCLAVHPRSIAVRAGIVVPAGQRGVHGADRHQVDSDGFE